MAKYAPELFHNRSATQDFLVSHTDNTVDDGNAAPHSESRNQTATALSTEFPDLLDREGLEEIIDGPMASAPAICVMAIQLERITAAESEIDQPATPLDDPVATLAAQDGLRKGVWARLGPDRFVCAFAELTDAEGLGLAETMLNAAGRANRLEITIGLAAYPTVNYSRRQTIENAEKALEHGTFFGPGTITRFDAVSLNISGDRRYQNGDIQGAVDEFKKGLLIDPTNANLHNSLGVCYGVLQDYDNALAAFENANWLAPEEVMAIYNKGYVFLLKDNADRALECFLEADRREPDVFEVVFHIGQIYMEMDRIDLARSYLEAATRANNRSGAAFKMLGACLDRLGLTKEAVQAYKGAVKINPEDAPSLSTLGRLYMEREESLDVAEVLCQQSVRLEPENGLYRHRLATAYLNQGKLADALSAFEAAVERGHDSQAEIEATQNRLMAAKAS